MKNGNNNFNRFLTNWVNTQHPVDGTCRFPKYGFLDRVSESLIKNRLLLVPKSRQMLISWTLCAMVLYSSLKNPGLHLLLSKNQFSADELLRRIRFIFDNLPKSLKLKTITRNRSELEIYRGGRIVSLPATEDAPRMHSPTFVFWDEMAYTPYSDKIWSALKPCLDNGAKFCGVSTPNGISDVFARLVSGAPDNGFAVHEVHWREHPERDKSWADEARKALSEVEWRREYEISFEGSSDLVYPEFTSENIVQGKFTPDITDKLYRSIDFGYRHPFVLWIAENRSGKLTVFDEWAGKDSTLEEMIEVITHKDNEYDICEDMVTFSACDPAGAAVDSTGVSPIDRLKRAGFKLRYRPSRINTGVEMVKALLRDANGAKRLKITSNAFHVIADIRRYRWKENGEEPEKDGICDHSMDALRYFAVNYLYASRPKILTPRIRGWRE